MSLNSKLVSFVKKQKPHRMNLCIILHPICGPDPHPCSNVSHTNERTHAVTPTHTLTQTDLSKEFGTLIPIYVLHLVKLLSPNP